MTTISWLHLSDWHQKGDDFDREVVRDALIRDIQERANRIDERLEKIDFIVFSGDLAFSGLENEFLAAQSYLLEPLLEAVQLDADKLFFVPGNHDLNQNTVYEMLPSELQKPLESDTLVQKWLLDLKKRERVLEPFDAYTKFVSQFTGQISPHYSSQVRYAIDDKQVALLGINSSWMCARNKESNGKINDYGFLLVGEPQIHDALKTISDADLRIAVIHHPLDWLAEFDRNHIEERLMRECHFILCGHQHKQRIIVSNSTSGNCIMIPAGASYDRRLTSDPRYTNSYNYMCLDLAKNSGTAYLRRWSEQRNEWIEDNESSVGGRFLIKSLPSNPGDKILSRSKVKSKPLLKTTERLMAAELRYRDLLLEACDIINLANLPEQDRHIAQRQQDLKLRNLFIPLRVRIEKPIDENPKGELDEDDWKRIEQSRNPLIRNRSLAKIDTEAQRITVGERLLAAKRLVILGDPGAGKTTLTRWVATAYLLRLKKDETWKELPDVKSLPDADLIPIIVRCRELDITSLHGSLEDILKHTLRKAELNKEDTQDLQKLLKERLRNGHAILLLDGLDEITDASVRAKFCQQIDKIVSAYPDAPIIATSRIVGYREMGYKLGHGFDHLILEDLVAEEKDEFARRWCMLTEVSERRELATNELIHDIHSAERIERLTGNPMLLTTMALVKRKVGKLPNRRAELYWEAVQVLLNWRREVDEPLDTREALPQLEYIAYAMCDRGVQQLRQDEILELFQAMRDEYPNIHTARNRSPEEFLKRLEARTGIIIEAGHIRHLGMLVPVYEFRHLTFQEYLAARALVDGRFPNRDVEKSLAANVSPLAGRVTKNDSYIRDESLVVENWREALRLCISICKDDDVDTTLLGILTPLDGDGVDIVRARSILAALCLADEPNTSTVVAEKIIQSLVEHATEKDGTRPRRTGLDSAICELANTRWNGMCRKYILSHFVQCTDEMKSAYGGLVAEIGHEMQPDDNEQLEKLSQELTKRLDSLDDTDVIESAIFIMQLAFQKKIAPVSGLADKLLSLLSEKASVAYSASWALAWLNGGPDYEEKASIWRPNRTQIQLLLNYVNNDQAYAYAVRFLTWILGREKPHGAVSALIPWLGNPEINVRANVINALSNFKAGTAVKSLLTRLKDDNKHMRRAAAQVLGRIGSVLATAPLIELLTDDDIGVRLAAIRALGAIEEEIAIPSLVPLLNEDNIDIRLATIQALSAIGANSATQSLIPLLEDDVAGIRLEAIKAFGAIGDTSATPSLIPLLKDDDTNTRLATIKALGAIGDDAATQPLVLLLADEDTDIRSATMEALGAIGDESATEALTPFLEDDVARIRLEAIKALGAIGDDLATQSLVLLLADDDIDTRLAAMEALAGNLDEIDQTLISQDLDASPPFVDPQQVISQAFTQRAAKILKLPVKDIHKRYKDLSKRFGLRLEQK